MPDQIFIGNFAKGLKTDRLPFNIDNDAFPKMINFYSWRGRAKRKRGTSFLGRLERQLESVVTPTEPWELGPIGTLDGAGAGSFNLISVFGLESTSTIAYRLVAGDPSPIQLTDGTNTYTEPATPNGTLVGTPAGTGTIDYASGDITITGGAAAGQLIGLFSYYPGLPVMGLRDFTSSPSTLSFPINLSFDTTYSYQINQVNALPFFYDVTYYKGTDVPFTWNGGDYQQFWTTNYQSAFWATNNVPGFHFVSGTYTSGTGTATITFHFESGGVDFPDLIVGDQLFFNEWDTGGSTINGLVGEVTSITGAATGDYEVTFDATQTVSGTGIAQLLTNSIPDEDGIRWYDGDPTSGTGIPTGTGLGWVNFSPPLTALTVSINNLPAAKYYLVGALAIVPFKDRLLFFSPWVQTSTGVPIQLFDTVIWSQNGTPYYNALVPTGPLSPNGESFQVDAYYVDQTGKGGFLSAGIAQPIATITANEDVLLVGFGGNGRKTRFVFTGNDLQPFLFFTINSELPSSATFSSIPLDRGGIDLGQYGLALTDQQSSQRIDLDIPDAVFEIQNLNNGHQRINAIRDFLREWIYFTYPRADSQWTFPTNSFLFNYRDNTWAVLYENYTTHGRYRPQKKNTWATIGVKFGSWENWNEPWNSGATSTLYASIIAGNPQGYVLILDQGTNEGTSGMVKNITNDGNGFCQINSPNHCVASANPLLNNGDFLLFSDGIGFLTATITNITLGAQTVITCGNTFNVNSFVTISGVNGTTQLNGNTYQIVVAAAGSITINVDSTDFDAYTSGGTATSAFNGLIAKVTRILSGNDNFVIDLPFPQFGPGGYLGLGNFARLSQPLIQTKQFPFYWEQGRQVRLGAQRYLLDYTENGQVTLNIYLSQDPDDVWNQVPIWPDIDTANSGLIYSQILYTCPESTNIGLTPANTNLQMPTAEGQFQIWHRVNTSLQGDSVQIGITLSDDQMYDVGFSQDEIVLHGMHLTLSPGPLLA